MPLLLVIYGAVMNLVRVWTDLDPNEISKRIIIVDDLHGFCPSCKATGIKYDSITKCPECGIEFKYVTTREKVNSEKGRKIIEKIIKYAPNLTILDYNDYKYVTDKNKAANLFSI